MSNARVTFEVSAIDRTKSALPEVPYHQAIAEMLSEPLQCQMRDLKRDIHESGETISRSTNTMPQKFVESIDKHREEQIARLKVLESKQHSVSAPVEACCRYHGRLVSGIQSHPLIAAIHHCFMDHRPLVLSPDMIWLLICQGVAQHVNVNADRLRSHFVQHAGKVRIIVNRNDFIKGSPENPWEEVIDEFSEQVHSHIGPAHDLFIPRFSTTSLTDRIASEIVLLDAVQSFFECILMTRCGIPTITLEGTANDWRELADRSMAFSQFDLEWWLLPLQKVLQEFVRAADGRIEQSFWRSLYKFESGSGADTVTGWITRFFPYLKDEQGPATRINPWLVESNLVASDGPSPESFPSGLSRAPFLWKYLQQQFDMEFLGGFVGVAQDPATLSLRPEIGWAIRQVREVSGL